MESVSNGAALLLLIIFIWLPFINVERSLAANIYHLAAIYAQEEWQVHPGLLISLITSLACAQYNSNNNICIPEEWKNIFAMIYDVKSFRYHAKALKLPRSPPLTSLFPLFSLQAGGLDLKENLAAAGGAPWPYPAVYPYEAAFAGYPFNG